MEACELISSFLKNFCSQVNVEDVPSVEVPDCMSKKRQRTADYQIFVGKPTHARLQPHLKRLITELLSASAEWPIPIAKCELVSSQPYVEVTLSRAAAYRSLFSFIYTRAEAEERQQPDRERQNVLIFVPHLDDSFTSVRTEKLAAYAYRCCVAQGLRAIMYACRPFYASERSSSINIITCSQACNSTARRRDVETVVKRTTFYREKDTTFDLKSYMASQGLETSGYGFCAGNVHIESPAFETAGLLLHVLLDHCEAAPDFVLIVAPACRSFMVHQAGLLCGLSLLQGQPQSTCMTKMVYAIHEGTYERVGYSFTDYRQQKRKLVSEAFNRQQADAHERTVTGDELLAAVDVLVDTEVAYEFLSNKPNVKIRLKQRINNAGSGHYFPQYTAARIVAILGKYEAAVREGSYPPLCDWQGVDFSLLCGDPEWLLWHGMVACWRALREESTVLSPTGDIRAELRAHLLCQALEGLCGHFSTYYSKVRVLVQPEPHLAPLVAARTWLLKAVRETVLRVLCRLGLQALDSM